MSNYNEYDDNQVDNSLDEEKRTDSINFDDLDLEMEFQKQLAAQRKTDRVRMLIAGFAVGLMLTAGVGYYVSEVNANSATGFGSYQTGTGAGYSATASYASSGQYTGTGSTAAAGAGAGGGGCSGGGCGGGSLGSASLPDLEKQALDKYKKETGAKDVTAKAGNFGCHIQIDISDKSGKIVRSYGYQGGPLYVIK